jgi:hypothetical protein
MTEFTWSCDFSPNIGSTVKVASVRNSFSYSAQRLRVWEVRIGGLQSQKANNIKFPCGVCYESIGKWDNNDSFYRRNCNESFLKQKELIM